MNLTPEEIDQLADEYIGAEDEGLNDRKAFLRVWRRVHRRFFAVWAADEVDQKTIRYEVARVMKRASEKTGEYVAMMEEVLRKSVARNSVIRLDNLTRQVFNRGESQ